MVTIDANPMRLVQGQYSIECTRCIGLVLFVLPIKIKIAHVFFSVAIQFVPQPMRTSLKNWLTDRQICHKILVDFEPPKTGPRQNLA